MNASNLEAVTARVEQQLSVCKEQKAELERARKMAQEAKDTLAEQRASSQGDMDKLKVQIEALGRELEKCQKDTASAANLDVAEAKKAVVEATTVLRSAESKMQGLQEAMKLKEGCVEKRAIDSAIQKLDQAAQQIEHGHLAAPQNGSPVAKPETQPVAGVMPDADEPEVGGQEAPEPEADATEVAGTEAVEATKVDEDVEAAGEGGGDSLLTRMKKALVGGKQRGGWTVRSVRRSRRASSKRKSKARRRNYSSKTKRRTSGRKRAGGARRTRRSRAGARKTRR